MILFCTYFYENCFGDIFSLYIQAAGLWWKAKYIYAVNAVANIILNYLLVRWLGIFGILLATIITGFLLGALSLGRMLFDNCFSKMSYGVYLFKKLLFLLIVISGAFITRFIIDLLPLSENIISFAIKIVICLIIPNAIMVFVFRNNELFVEMKQMMMSVIKGAIKKRR